jgi:hypothetical protein
MPPPLRFGQWRAWSVQVFGLQVFFGHWWERFLQPSAQSEVCRCCLQFFGQGDWCHFSPQVFGSSQPCRQFARWTWNQALITPVSRST